MKLNKKMQSYHKLRLVSFGKSKKALSGVVVVALLFLASLTFYFSSQEWFDDYTNNLKNTLDKPNLENNFQILKVDGTELYLKNNFEDNLTLKSIKVGDTLCSISEVDIDKGNVIVDIGGCTAGYNELDAKEIVLITDIGIVSEFEVLRNPVEKSLIVKFQMSPCDFSSGYIRLFGLTNLENAHVDVDGTSTYNVCFRHFDFTISAGLGGAVTQDLFYLIGINNSAVWTNKSSVLVEPASWEDVVLSSSGGVFDYQISSIEPSPKHTCIGSLDVDNIYGSHFGDCESSLPDKIWLKLE